MNKKLQLIVGTVVAVIVVSFAFVLMSDDETMTNTVTQQQTTQTNQTVTEDANTAETRAYVAFTEESFASTEGTRLLFFHAPWCPQCRALENDIEANDIPAGVTIFKVDYDSNQELRKKYGVTIQTTIVRVDESGNLLEKFVAYDDPSLKAIKDTLL